MKTMTIGLLIGIALVACNQSKSGDDQQASPTPVASSAATPPATVSAAPVASAQPATVEIKIASVGNNMQFDKTKLTVPAGSKVHLEFKNVATTAAFQHNWALVMPGTEAKVAAEGLEKAATSGYIVPGPNVIAYTSMAAPGMLTDVTFTAPPPGDYPYICTFPGHYMMMKGVLTVTP